MTTITQTITELGTAADPLTQAPATFSANAAANVLGIKTAIPEMNTAFGQLNTVSGEVNANAVAANLSASNAATSESNAATSASDASTSASDASTSASTASAAAIDAAASYDNFDDRYLGQKANNPTLDNDGNALLTGALYFNTTSTSMKVYSGVAWIDVAAVATSIDAATQVTGTLPIANGGTGLTSLGTGIDTFLGTPSSANLAAAVTDETGTGALVFGASPTLTTPTFTGLKETSVAVGASNIDLSLGNHFTRTISGTTTLTVSNVPTTGNYGSFVLDLTNGGAATVNWWSGVKWAAGIAPTLTAAGRDSLGFYTYDGGTIWTGLVLGKDVK